MADQCYKMVDMLFVGEAWKPAGSARFADAARFRERWRIERSIRWSDELRAADSWHGFSAVMQVDVLHVNEAWMLVGAPTVRMTDAARFGERWRAQRTVVLSDSAQVHDRWMLSRSVKMTDARRATERWVPVQTPTVRMADAARVGERWSSWRMEHWADTARWGERFFAVRSMRMADTARVGERWSARAEPIAVMRDRMRVAERWRPVREPMARWSDELFAEERYLPGGRRAQGWTANTDTWAMSRYEDWPIHSLVAIDGVLYGAASDGLYRLDADDDAGAPIDAHFTTALTDQGGETPRHTRAVYAGATTPGQLRATVYHVTDRIPARVTYTFERRPADEFAPQRVKLGRGIKSRYLQFTIGNVAGADFLVDTLSLMADATSRRV